MHYPPPPDSPSPRCGGSVGGAGGCLRSSGSPLPVKLERNSTCAEKQQDTDTYRHTLTCSKLAHFVHVLWGRLTWHVDSGFILVLDLFSLCSSQFPGKFVKIYLSDTWNILITCWPFQNFIRFATYAWTRHADFLFSTFVFVALFGKPCVSNTNPLVNTVSKQFHSVWLLVRWWIMRFLLKEECQKCPRGTESRTLSLLVHCVLLQLTLLRLH